MGDPSCPPPYNATDRGPPWLPSPMSSLSGEVNGDVGKGCSVNGPGREGTGTPRFTCTHNTDLKDGVEPRLPPGPSLPD